jgi:hypothetical protein
MLVISLRLPTFHKRMVLSKLAKSQMIVSPSRSTVVSQFYGIELEYEVRGTGEPVILVHTGVFAEWFKPLLNEPELTGRYRLVRYHEAEVARLRISDDRARIPERGQA